MVISRVYSGATGDAAGRVDLLSIAEHELGHALGLSFDNSGASTPIIITAPRPFAGEEIPSVEYGSPGHRRGAHGHATITGRSLLDQSR